MAALATTAIVVALLVFLPRLTAPRGAQGPEDLVAAMLAAERDGDTPRLLDCFDGPLQTQRLRAGSGESADRNRGMVGYVTTGLKLVEPAGATLVLERIFTDHHERQRIELRQLRSGWKIVEITPLDQFVPDIPYGTPIVPPSK